MDEKNQVFKIKGRLEFERQRKNFLVLVAKQRKLFEVNSVGKFILSQINGQNNLADIITALQNNFDVQPKKAEKDVLKFIKTLKALDLIKRT